MDNKKQQYQFYGMALSGFIIMMVAMFVEIMAGLGSQFEWWHYSTGFVILKWGVYSAVAGVVLSIGGFIYLLSEGSRIIFLPVWALVLSFFIIGVPAGHIIKAKDAPMIHEITTDIGSPPLFATLGPIRYGATNSAEYDVLHSDRLIQMDEYRDIKTLVLKMKKPKVVNIVFDVVKSRGWEVVYSNKQEGIIEATAKTFWFGFKDDVSIRVKMFGREKSSVDMRSLSRVGKGDAGRNAKRVRDFISDVSKRAEMAKNK